MSLLPSSDVREKACLPAAGPEHSLLLVVASAVETLRCLWASQLAGLAAEVTVVQVATRAALGQALMASPARGAVVVLDLPLPGGLLPGGALPERALPEGALPERAGDDSLVPEHLPYPVQWLLLAGEGEDIPAFVPLSASRLDKPFRLSALLGIAAALLDDAGRGEAPAGEPDAPARSAESGSALPDLVRGSPDLAGEATTAAVISSGAMCGEIRLGPHQLYLARRELLTAGGQVIRLTEKECAILDYLRRQPAAVDRQRLLQAVWGYGDGISTHTLETHIYRLRQKIEANPSRAELLVTEDSGYRLILTPLS